MSGLRHIFSSLVQCTDLSTVYNRAGGKVERGVTRANPHGQVGASKVERSSLGLSCLLSYQNLPRVLSPFQGEHRLGLCPASPHPAPKTTLASSSLESQKHLYHIPCGNSVFTQGRKAVSLALDAGKCVLPK